MLDLKKMIEKLLQHTGTRVITISGVSSLPAGVASKKINENYVVVNSVLSNPAAQTSDWTVITSNYTDSTTNNVVISDSGSISGTTDVTLYLEMKNEA